MKNLSNFIMTASNKIQNNLALRLAYYGVITAALIVMYLVMDGEGVAFVYNEF